MTAVIPASFSTMSNSGGIAPRASATPCWKIEKKGADRRAARRRRGGLSRPRNDGNEWAHVLYGRLMLNGNASHLTQYILWFRARRRADLAAAFRGMRDVTGLSQAQLADAIHSSRSSVSRMEHGEDVTLDVAMRSVEKLVDRR